MLPDLLHRARRRVIAQLVLDKGALALAIGMGGAILLLLAGTQILDWWWPVLLALASAGVGIYQLRRHIPSIYTLAQRIDERLHLADTLSTAVYFSDHPKPGAEAVCEVQRRSAEDTARTVDLQQALPYARSRWLFPAVGLLLVAAGLFAVRYAVVGSMDLSPSLVGMALDTFFQSPAEEEAKLNARADLRPNPFDPSQQASATEELSELSPEEAAELMDAEGKQEEGNASGDEGKQEDPTAEAQDENEGSAKDKDKQGDKSGDKDGKESEQQEGNNDNRSMMDKLRDAVSNLLNQMKSDQNKQQAQQKGDQKGKSGEKGQKGEKGEKGEKGDSQAERADGQPQQSDSQQAKQEKQNQDGQPGDSEGQKQEDAAAGAGQQEGKKDIEQAKMLEAMGKLSELLGQRSQEVTGQVMVEVGKTDQQLRTQYSDQQAGHAEAGSEIHRDEIPLMYQQYVERYFEEIRKGPEAPKATAAPKAAPAPKGKGE